MTDQPEEELLALLENRTLARGHTGMELDLPPATPIDTARDAAIVEQRTREFRAASTPVDPALVAAVREGRVLDHSAEFQHDPAARRAVDARAESLGRLDERYRGAPLTHHLNAQAEQIEPED